MKQEFFTPEFIYIDLSKKGIEYILDAYAIDLKGLYKQSTHSDGYTPHLNIPSFRVIGINPHYLRENTYTTCFLVLIRTTVVKLFSEHIWYTWDYVHYKSLGIVE